MRKIVEVQDGDLPPEGAKFLYSSVRSRTVAGDWRRASNVITEFLSGRERFERSIREIAYTVHCYEVEE